jgi:hypothetical protein
MRSLCLLLFSVLLVCAAGTDVAGHYTGEWKSDSSGAGGVLRMSLDPSPNAAWKCEISFTLTGEEVKTRMQSFQLENSQLEVAYDFDVQGNALRSKLTGHWDGKGFAGRYQTTLLDSGDPVDAGTWTLQIRK